VHVRKRVSGGHFFPDFWRKNASEGGIAAIEGNFVRDKKRLSTHEILWRNFQNCRRMFRRQTREQPPNRETSAAAGTRRAAELTKTRRE
jgi:hypothetical protein